MAKTTHLALRQTSEALNENPADSLLLFAALDREYLWIKGLFS